MTEMQKAIIEKAASLVGCGYIYGATGWICTNARLEAQAKQYPQYADSIRKYGPKWLGKLCFDCAQLTRVAAKAAGIILPSGATSQFKAAVYEALGTIGSLPHGEPAIQLWRQKSGAPNTMEHTGLYMGDGTVVEARGHQYGCQRRALSASPWTHWGRYKGALGGAEILVPEYPAIPPVEAPHDLIRLLKLTNPTTKGEDVRKAQQLLLAHDIACLPKYGADGVFGNETSQAVVNFQRKVFPSSPREWDGIIGTRTWDKLMGAEV